MLFFFCFFELIMSKDECCLFNSSAHPAAHNAAALSRHCITVARDMEQSLHLDTGKSHEPNHANAPNL